MLPRWAPTPGELGRNTGLLPQNQGLGTEAQRSAYLISFSLDPGSHEVYDTDAQPDLHTYGYEYILYSLNVYVYTETHIYEWKI